MLIEELLLIKLIGEIKIKMFNIFFCSILSVNWWKYRIIRPTTNQKYIL